MVIVLHRTSLDYHADHYLLLVSNEKGTMKETIGCPPGQVGRKTKVNKQGRTIQGFNLQEAMELDDNPLDKSLFQRTQVCQTIYYYT